MNSKQLQQLYPHVYEKFFQQHEVILSSPFTANLNWDIMRSYLSIWIRQKIPLRMYIGISQWSSWLELGEIIFYDLIESDFVTKSLQNSWYYNQLFQEIKKKYPNLPLKINILAECSPALALSDSFVSMILVGILYMTNKIDQNKLYDIKQKPINDILQQGDENWFVRNCIIETLSVYIAVQGRTSHMHFMSSFFDGGYPIIWFREYKKNRLKDLTVFRNFYGFRVNDLRPEIGNSYDFPYDQCLIYAWKPWVSKTLDGSHTNKLHYEQTQKELFEKIGPFLWDLPQENKPIFYKNLLQPSIEEISELYAKMISLFSMDIIYLLKQILGKNYSEQLLQRFLSILKKCNITNDIVIWTNSSEVMNFMNDLSSHLNTPQTNIAIFPEDTVIYWGCINTISPLESARKNILEFIKNYKTRTIDNTAWLIYASWLDGIETEWIKIEQDIRNKIHSWVSKKTNYKLINRDGTVYMRSYQDAIQDCNNDVLIDLIKNKIYIHGKICSSKELHSQTTTAEILSKFIEKNRNALTSKDLLPSSYTKNKNEMITKVINPFIKLIKDKCNQIIVISCNGPVTNYTIEFDLKDIKIGIIKDI